MTRRQKQRFKALRDSTLQRRPHLLPCLGHQGTCHVIVGLCQQDLGTQGLGAVAILGGTLSTGADEEGGQDHQEAPVPSRPYRLNAIVLKVSNGPAARHQQPHQGDQGSEPWLPQSTRSALPTPFTSTLADSMRSSTQRPSASNCYPPDLVKSPKKSGPDHWAPVISRAMRDRLR